MTRFTKLFAFLALYPFRPFLKRTSSIKIEVEVQKKIIEKVWKHLEHFQVSEGGDLSWSLISGRI